MEDEIKVTVIAAGFDRWDSDGEIPIRQATEEDGLGDLFEDDGDVEDNEGLRDTTDIFASDDDDDEDGFDVPSFLK